MMENGFAMHFIRAVLITALLVFSLGTGTAQNSLPEYPGRRGVIHLPRVYF